MIILDSDNISVSEREDFLANVDKFINMTQYVESDNSLIRKESSGSIYDEMYNTLVDLSKLKRQTFQDMVNLGWCPIIKAPPREYPGLTYYKCKHIETSEIAIVTLIEGDVPHPAAEFARMLKPY